MQETFIQTEVTYALNVGERLVVIENAPARVCRETGEQLFAPETVEHLQQLVSGAAQPRRPTRRWNGRCHGLLCSGRSTRADASRAIAVQRGVVGRILHNTIDLLITIRYYIQ